MDAPTRRHRTSDKPNGKSRAIEPHQIDQRYIEVLKKLEPYHYFKYLTIPWLHYLTDLGVEYSVFRKYLGYLRQAPNHYLACPISRMLHRMSRTKRSSLSSPSAVSTS